MLEVINRYKKMSQSRRVKSILKIISKQLQVTQIFSTYNYQRTQMKDFSILVNFFQIVIARVYLGTYIEAIFSSCLSVCLYRSVCGRDVRSFSQNIRETIGSKMIIWTEAMWVCIPFLYMFFKATCYVM